MQTSQMKIWLGTVLEERGQALGMGTGTGTGTNSRLKMRSLKMGSGTNSRLKMGSLKMGSLKMGSGTNSRVREIEPDPIFFIVPIFTIIVGCIIIAALFIFTAPSIASAATPRSASVSATVLPTPENTKPKRQKNFFEKMDPYQQMTFASVAGLSVLVIGAGGVFVLRRNKKRPTG